MRRIGNLAYELDLLETMHIYSVVSVQSLFEAFPPEQDQYSRFYKI
jgi:hypothetical protein